MCRLTNCLQTYRKYLVRMANCIFHQLWIALVVKSLHRKCVITRVKSFASIHWRPHVIGFRLKEPSSILIEEANTRAKPFAIRWKNRDRSRVPAALIAVMITLVWRASLRHLRRNCFTGYQRLNSRELLLSGSSSDISSPITTRCGYIRQIRRECLLQLIGNYMKESVFH